jgi:hypothetical protein
MAQDCEWASCLLRGEDCAVRGECCCTLPSSLCFMHACLHLPVMFVIHAFQGRETCCDQAVVYVTVPTRTKQVPIASRLDFS